MKLIRQFSDESTRGFLKARDFPNEIAKLREPRFVASGLEGRPRRGSLQRER